MYLLSSYYVPGILCMRKQQKTREKKKKIPASKLYSNREEIDTLNKKKQKPYILFNQSHLKEAL